MMSFLPVTQRTIRRATLNAAFAAALAIASSAAYAQKPSPAALLTASEIVSSTGAASLFTPLIPGVIEQAKNLFLQQDPSLAKDLNEITAKMRNDLAPRLSELTGEVAKLYVAHFSEQELKDLLAFYKSPVGKKLIATQPVIADDSLKFAQNWANTLSDEVVAKMRDELKKKGHLK
jgi:hypothetical protein